SRTLTNNQSLATALTFCRHGCKLRALPNPEKPRTSLVRHFGSSLLRPAAGDEHQVHCHARKDYEAKVSEQGVYLVDQLRKTNEPEGKGNDPTDQGRNFESCCVDFKEPCGEGIQHGHRGIEDHCQQED